MQSYLAIFTGTAEGRQRSGWDPPDQAKRAELERAGMQAWGDAVEVMECQPIPEM